MIGLLCGKVWIEDPCEAKGRCEFSGIPAAYTSYREGSEGPVEGDCEPPIHPHME